MTAWQKLASYLYNFLFQLIERKKMKERKKKIPQSEADPQLTHHKYDGLHLSWLEAAAGKNERQQLKLFFS